MFGGKKGGERGETNKEGGKVKKEKEKNQHLTALRG